MSAKDFYHNTVRDALDKDGWKITHDPLEFRVGVIVRIDLAAEQLITAVLCHRLYSRRIGGRASQAIGL